jgi:hypothetical protein
MDALRSADEAEKKDAIVLLIRDRLVVEGGIDEKHFRFLAGKPAIDDATWLVDFSHDDVDWERSTIRAPRADPHFALPEWFLIEIATAGLSLFGSMTAGKPTRKKRIGPEFARAQGALKKIYGEKIPAMEEVPNKDLEKIVNDRLKLDGLKVVKADAVQRASGRRR